MDIDHLFNLHIPNLMKKTFLTLAVAATLATGAPLMVSAQTSAVTNAILNQRTGLLDKARVDIDKAIVNEKTSGKAKTWFTRGEIYEGMVTNPIYSKQLQPGEGTQKAYESYMKAIELDGKTGEFGKQAVAKLDNIYVFAFNDALANYNAKDFDKAITNFKLASTIRPTDTTAVINTAAMYDMKKDVANAKLTYNQLLGLGYKKPSVYLRLLQIAREENNQQDAAKVLQQALAVYPNNKTFLIEDLNLSMRDNKDGNAAIEKINKAIASDPSNSNLYAVRGSLYDTQKKPDLAQTDYKKAVELDPNNFDAVVNLGVYQFNRGIEMVNRARKMDLKTYNATGKKLEADGKKVVELSIPYFERASKLQSTDRLVLSSLQKAYANTGRMADAERISAMIQSLKK